MDDEHTRLIRDGINYSRKKVLWDRVRALIKVDLGQELPGLRVKLSEKAASSTTRHVRTLFWWCGRQAKPSAVFLSSRNFSANRRKGRQTVRWKDTKKDIRGQMDRQADSRTDV